MSIQTISQEANYVLKFINQTNQSVFLTGKAGTGKTTLLKEIIETTHKNTVVVAPTGIAALNAGAVTIHSMFQLPFGGFIPENIAPHFSENTRFETKNTLRRQFRMSGIKKTVIQNMELLIIDEVSMLRPDLLDAIDFVIQNIRKKHSPFGGVQVLLIGDLLQLPPVIKEEEWRILKKYYTGKFFFHANVIKKKPPLYIELSKIFRQTEPQFISILNNLRNNQISTTDIKFLNKYVQPNFNLKDNKGYIILTTHNANADSINAKSLKDLETKEFIYSAEITDEFPDKMYPIEENLKIKVGAQIMFIKNDLSLEKKYFNGKMGFIKSLSKEEILVHFLEENKTIEVERYEWQNIRYKVDEMTKEITEEVLGTFVHYPIKLAWAITIHKSQGLTFDKAALDVSQVFMPGQAYVALSRLRSLNGLVLLSPIQMNGISNDKDVMDYSMNKASDELLTHTLQKETQVFIHNFILNSFDWDILFQEWQKHQKNYNQKKETAQIIKNKEWAKKQVENIETVLKSSKKFLLQLQSIFEQKTVNFNYLLERITAAYDYFFVPMDNLEYQILLKIEEVKYLKNGKALYEELLIIEELQTKAILNLMKTKLMVETITSGKELSKENLNSAAINTYKIKKIEKIKAQFKELNSTLIEDDIDEIRYKKIKKQKQDQKKSTLEETHELWLNKNTIQEIARIRKLSPQTIGGHIAKLIEVGKISIYDILPKNKILELSKIFKDYQDSSLAPLKERYGEKYSWEELKMFKSSLIKQ